MEPNLDRDREIGGVESAFLGGEQHCCPLDGTDVESDPGGGGTERQSAVRAPPAPLKSIRPGSVDPGKNG